jgi:HD-like signal output (HDOD) protein
MTVLTLLRDPERSMPEIAKALSQDAALSVAVLRQANSPAAGLRRAVPNVQHAVSLLGRATVESIVVTEMVRDAVPSRSAPGFEPQRFWAAASRRSNIARELAGILDPGNAMVAATASLLQDIAVPLLVHRQSDNYAPVLQRWHADGGDLSEQERDTFGWDHSNVGEWLCKAWDLPAELTELIGAHHSPESCAAPVALVAARGEEPSDDDIDRLVALGEQRCNTPPEVIIRALRLADTPLEGAA